MSELKYTPSFAELIDRLNIVSSKSVYSKGGADKFKQETDDIIHDIDVHLKSIIVTGDMIRAIILLTQANLAIWLGEEGIRDFEGKDSEIEVLKKLRYTHSLNGTRSQCKTRIQNLVGGRVDPKLNCLAEGSAWNIKW